MPVCGEARRLSFYVVLMLSLLACSAVAQETAPRIDIFGGYAWLRPGEGTVATVPLKNTPGGWGAAMTYNFTRALGLTFDGGAHYGDMFRVGTFTVGPRVKFRSEKIAPFLGATFGLHRLSFAGVDPNNNVGLALGGGLDVPLSPRVEFRALQADYLFGHHDFSNVGGGTLNLNGVRLRSGIVFNLGQIGPPPEPLGATCAAQPAQVFAGEPITVTATAQNIPKKHNVSYAFQTTGGKLQAKDNVANVDTAGLEPGAYRVTGTVTDSKAKKAPPATCEAAFTVQERPKHPPSIACSANATTVKAGEPVTITCTSQNPDNRQLTYDWNASGGKLAPNQTSATLDTTGAPAGPISVTTKVSDDRGLNATASTTVNVEVPPPPPQASKIGEVVFKPRNARVDNTAKAVLDDIALRLQRDADAKAVIVGFSDPQTEKRIGDKLAAQRAVNAKAYLVRDKGIDPARIEARTGTAGGTRAEIWLVPAGATFDSANTIAVDETKVKAPPARRRRR